ncbi:cupin domain-containing protein [Pseudonocardia sp.]|uniref:cupin domain-containing protein n=1 Tax=Pseudonocardia sp. TaxID=60912 RepID=UPI003D0B7367
MNTDPAPRPPVHRAPGEGRHYPMSRMNAVFKADGTETADRYSISEWWLEPHTTGVGEHSHPEDDVFYVLDGTMTFLLGDRWIDAPKGSLVLAPGGTPHGFCNRTGERAGALNFSVPGGFEPRMPGIVEWFREHPPGDPAAAEARPPDRPAGDHAPLDR